MSTTYGFTNKYLTKDGKPWFPVMGEIHFSRYRADLWEESLRKMKAGGLSIASVYVIWIHHEEEEGKNSILQEIEIFMIFWKQQRKWEFLYFFALVRGYMERQETEDFGLAAKKQDEIDLRSNDPAYLAYVRRLWEKVYEQAKGFCIRMAAR